MCVSSFLASTLVKQVNWLYKWVDTQFGSYKKALNQSAVILLHLFKVRRRRPLTSSWSLAHVPAPSTHPHEPHFSISAWWREARSRWTRVCICRVQTGLCTRLLGESVAFVSASRFLSAGATKENICGMQGERNQVREKIQKVLKTPLVESAPFHVLFTVQQILCRFFLCRSVLCGFNYG